MNLRELIEILIKSRTKGAANIDQEILYNQARIAQEVYNIAVNANSGKLFLLKAPTGFGKTETFISPYLYSIVQNTWFAGRAFIVMPIHALLSQMKERIRGYVGSINSRITVGEDHGEASEKTFLYNSIITLTTVDSYAYGYVAKRVMSWVFRGIETGRYSMPAGIIMNSYTVFDEAHLIQDEAYLAPRILSKIISSIVNSGGIIMFSTATMPSKLLDLFKARISSDNVVELSPVKLGKKKEVNITLHKEKITMADITPEECNNSTIIFVNTIDRARELYFKLRERCKNLTILHSLMRKKERDKVIEEVQRDGKMLISTQAAEVGIDIKSFKKVYTEWAPLDSLIQRFGRVRDDHIEAHIFEVDNSLPYLDSVIDMTKKVLNNVSRIDLNDTELITELLDNVYTQDLIDLLSEKGDSLYLESLEYLHNLHLYSYPPEQDIALRPSYYATLYVVDKIDDCDKLNPGDLNDYQIKYSISKISEKGVKRLINLLQRVDKMCIFNNGRYEEISDKDKIIRYIEDQVQVEVVIEKDKIYDEAGIKTEVLKETVTEEKRKRSRKKR